MIDWILFWKICAYALPVLVILLAAINLITNSTKSNNTMAKRIYRLKSDRKIAGVCGGIANYFDIDPVIIRLAWLMAVFCFGGGVLAYIIAVIVIPSEDSAR